MTTGKNNPIQLPEGYSEKELLELIEILSDSLTGLKKKSEYFQMGKDAFLNMLEDINDSYKELKELFLGLVSAMVNALDAKSPWTKGHSERVASYAEQIAERMNFDKEEIRSLQLSGMLHDIGKIGTYDYLLDKPDTLTEEEFATVKKHPVQGAKIIEGIKQLSDIAPVIRYHHERLDGRGYPDGLKGQEIPIYARILHIADSYDSMTSDRPYRHAPGIEYALSEFKKYSGTQFDSRIVDIFMDILKDETGTFGTIQ